MIKSPWRKLVLFLSATPLLMVNVSAMEGGAYQTLNGVVNHLTEHLALHAYQQTPDQNTLVSGVGPAVQLLTTAACLANTENKESIESRIKKEIQVGLGLHSKSDVTDFLYVTASWRNKLRVKHAHLIMVPEQNKVPVKALLNPYWAVGVEEFDLSDHQKAANLANQWVENQTQGYITKIAEAKDFPGAVQNLFLSALFVAARWNHHFTKTTMQFYGKDKKEPILVNGLRDKQQVYVYESEYSINPFKIVNIKATDNLFLALKMYDNGFVSPITVKEFDEPAKPCVANLKFPSFDFTTSMDLSFLKQTFPTLFEKEYQTTLTSSPTGLSAFKQQNFMKVYDAGFMAGSATMKVEGSLCESPTPEVTIVIDKPFSFLAFQKTEGDQRDGANFLHLFSGTVVDLPNQADRESLCTFMRAAQGEMDEAKRKFKSAEAEFKEKQSIYENARDQYFGFGKK